MGVPFEILGFIVVDVNNTRNDISFQKSATAKGNAAPSQQHRSLEVHSISSDGKDKEFSKSRCLSTRCWLVSVGSRDIRSPIYEALGCKCEGESLCAPCLFLRLVFGFRPAIFNPICRPHPIPVNSLGCRITTTIPVQSCCRIITTP